MKPTAADRVPVGRNALSLQVASAALPSADTVQLASKVPFITIALWSSDQQGRVCSSRTVLQAEVKAARRRHCSTPGRMKQCLQEVLWCGLCLYLSGVTSVDADVCLLAQ